MRTFRSQWDALSPVPFENWSGEEIPPFSLCPIIGAVRDTKGDILYYKLGKASTTFYRQWAITGAQPVPSTIGSMKGRGVCFRGGDLRFAYDPSASPAADEGFGPKPGEFAAFKGFPHLLTVSLAFETDNKWCYGHFTGEITTLLCKATAALSAGAVSSNFQIWSGTMASGSNSGYTTLPTIEIGVPIDSGLFFHASWTNNGWIGGPLQCNA